MDKDRIKGSAKKFLGGVKQATGKLVGDTKLEAEGHAQKVAGAAQNAVGGMKDSVRETFAKK
jgi:uncharacterized protein YjbJ (UPF0337 family)